MPVALGLRCHYLVGLLVIFCSTIQAQQKEGEPRYRIVNGYAVHGYADGREIGYNWYETEDEAIDAKAKMEKVETTTGKYYDKVEIKPETRRIPIQRPEKSTQPPIDPPPAKGTKIEIKRPIFVDPGSPTKGKGSVLAGKRGTGKIGDFNATIEFGQDGQFTISGEIQGKGKWSETDTGGVYMETERSTFRGNIKGNTVSGLWFTKDNSRPLTEWSITLGSDAAAAGARIAGTWINTTNKDKITITPAGSFTLHSWTGLLESSGTVKSTTDGGSVKVRIDLVNSIQNRGRGWEITGTNRTPFDFEYDLSNDRRYQKVK